MTQRKARHDKSSKGYSLDELFDIEKMEKAQEKYRFETRMVFTGKKDEKGVEGFICLAKVGINNETDRICYVESEKEDWFRRVRREEISYIVLLEQHAEGAIEKGVDRFKEQFKKYMALLNEPPFDVNELRKGGSHHEDYVNFIEDSRYEIDPEMQENADDSPYY